MDLVTPVIDLFHGFPPWLIVLIIAAVPFIELRGAIPVAIGLYGMNPVAAIVLSVIGNMLPVFIIFYFLEPVSIFLSRHSKLFERFFEWLFKRAERKGNNRVEKYKGLALATFVAIPLPMTGAWMATVVSLVLKFKPRNAFISIFAGVAAAGIIVTIITVSGVQIWDWLVNR